MIFVMTITEIKIQETLERLARIEFKLDLLLLALDGENGDEEITGPFGRDRSKDEML